MELENQQGPWRREGFSQNVCQRQCFFRREHVSIRVAHVELSVRRARIPVALSVQQAKSKRVQ